MLAAAAPTVKLARDTTPEQRSCAQDIDQALTIFWNPVERVQDAADQEQPIHQVEEIIFRDVLTMGLALLRSFLAASGDGDVGPTLDDPRRASRRATARPAPARRAPVPDPSLRLR